MRNRNVYVGVVGVVLLFAAETVATPRRCFPVKANIQVGIQINNCISPVGLCTNGHTDHGLRGTTSYVGTALQLGAASQPGYEGAVFSFAGDFRWATRHGTLIADDAGTLDYVTNTYVEVLRVQGGTGRFRGATGIIYSYGTVNEDGLGFTGVLTGRVCVPRR